MTAPLNTATRFNNAQMHLLTMFSHCNSESDTNEMRDVLAKYYAEKVQQEADALWDSGMLGEQSIDELLNEHLRTPYNK